MNRSYTAVVLDSKSQSKVKEWFAANFPKLQDWKVIAHHMTITLGEAPDSFKKRLGKKVEIRAFAYGFSDRAFALRVDAMDAMDPDRLPHITVAVNEKEGAKPAESNEIKKWVKLKRDIYLSGFVQEL